MGADVDCTTDAGKSVCQDNGVSGYPTIKYFNADTGKSGSDYSGGRSFDDLSSFVETELKQDCNPKTKENCDDQEKAYVDKMIEKGEEKWKAEATRLQGLAAGQASTDKAAWVQKRLSILELLLGIKKPKARRMKTSTKIAIGVGISILVVAVLVYWCMRDSGDEVINVKEAPKEEKKEEEKKED